MCSLLDDLAWLRRRDEAPGVPGDLEDHERDEEADDRVRARQTDCDEGSARDHAERYEAVRPSVVAVRDESRAGEPLPRAKTNVRGQLVAQEPDRPGDGERP